MTKKVGMQKLSKTNSNWIETSKVLYRKYFFRWPQKYFFWFLLQKRIIQNGFPNIFPERRGWGNHNMFLEIWDHVTMNTTTFSKWSSSEIRVSENLTCWADLLETNSISNQNRQSASNLRLEVLRYAQSRDPCPKPNQNRTQPLFSGRGQNNKSTDLGYSRTRTLPRHHSCLLPRSRWSSFSLRYCQAHDVSFWKNWKSG